MSDEWKHGPKSTLRVKASQPARYEENEPFLRPMAADQLFRPGASAPTGMPAYGQRLTHRQAASMRPVQQERRRMAFDVSGYGHAPSGYAPIPPSAISCYSQPGYMPCQAPMSGCYAGVPTGGAWSYSDPYAYGQPPVYPSYAGQPPMIMPGCPRPYALVYTPYPQATISTPPASAAPPPMQTPLPGQAVQRQPDAPVSPRHLQPMPLPAVEAVPKQAVLQTFPPASMPERVRPSRAEAYSKQAEPAPAEAQPFYPTAAAEFVPPQPELKAEAQALPVKPWVAAPVEPGWPDLQEDIVGVAHAEFQV